nr:integrase, catalytic region, zinc finger, CCHC-type, peptidase aspartic, catalytic [Tanacetum cinerariifolium]
MFLWAEAVATACYTQNRSLIHTRHHKTPYELVHNKKPDLTFFRVFGALCYPTNDSEDLGKLQPTADSRIFVGYAPSRNGIPPGVVAEPHFMEDHNVALVDNNPFFGEIVEGGWSDYPVAKGDTMANMTAPTGQAPIMAPPIRTNDQTLPSIRWVQTGYLKFSTKGTKREVFRMPIHGFGNPNTGSVTSFGTMISFTDAFSASSSDKKLESHATLEDRKDLSQPG